MHLRCPRPPTRDPPAQSYPYPYPYLAADLRWRNWTTFAHFRLIRVIRAPFKHIISFINSSTYIRATATASLDIHVTQNRSALDCL